VQSFAEWKSCEQPANAMVVKARTTLLNASLYRNGGASSLRVCHSMNREIVPSDNSPTGPDHAGLVSDPGKQVLVQACGSARSVESRNGPHRGVFVRTPSIGGSEKSLIFPTRTQRA
jgi:hypothetical protein